MSSGLEVGHINSSSSMCVCVCAHARVCMCVCVCKGGRGRDCGEAVTFKAVTPKTLSKLLRSLEYFTLLQ